MDSQGDPDLKKLGSRLQEARKRAFENTKESFESKSPPEHTTEKVRLPKFIVVSSPSRKNPPVKEYVVEEKIIEIHETVEVKKVRRNLDDKQKVKQEPKKTATKKPVIKTKPKVTKITKRESTPREVKQSEKTETKILPSVTVANTQNTFSPGTEKENSSLHQDEKILLENKDSLSSEIDLNSDEREDVQKKTFTKWINSQLTKKNHPPITDLFYDIRDGTRLLTLLEVLTDKTFKREKGRMRVHHLNNVAKALKVLEGENVKLVNISNEHIVDGSPKITLGLIWAVILHWQVKGVLKDVMSELQQTNLEKTLLAWCRQTTQGYHGVDVRNFTTSWRDGLAFCAIIHRHRPDFFEWPVMAKKHPYARLDNAFRIAQENLGIERLLDPEDVNTQNPDKKSIMMYVMCLFQSLPHSSISMDSLNISVQSDSSYSIEASESAKDIPGSSAGIGIGISTYQQTLEEVLTWLLGAEDRLAGMAEIADNTKDVKSQFHQLEDLLLDLTSRQGGIGDVLSEGSRLLRENVLGEEESEEIRVQMKLLNTRWEELRIKVMSRQTSLHEQLMKLQQEELDILKSWLTKTEDRIANMSEIGPKLTDLNDQITAHKALQKDLEDEQENISSLSNMVVVEDENNSDTAYSSLEDELTALGERWAHICKWAEQRWSVLQNLRVQWSDFDKEMERCQSWLNEKERFLKELESNPTEQREEMLEQAVSLQILQTDIENETQRQNALHALSNNVLSLLPPESSAQETIPSALEEMQDRWECLLSILEAQKQRFLVSGIDINKMVPITKTETYVTVTTDEEGNTVKRVTTKTILSEKTEVSTHKRQKMTGETQQEFNNAILEFGTWIELIENRLLPSHTYSLPSEEMNQICNEVEEELKKHEEDYKKVLSLGHSATSETATVGESTVDNEIKMTSLRTRWTGLEKSLKNLRLRIKFNDDLKSIKSQLEELEKERSSLEKWINDLESCVHFHQDVVECQIEDCKEKKEDVKIKEDQLSKLEKDAQTLPSLWSEEKDEVLRNVQALLFDYKNLFMRITNREFILKEKFKSVFEQGESQLIDEEIEITDSNLNTELEEGLEELNCWLAKAEEELEACPAMAPLPKMQDGLSKFKAILKEVDGERDKLSSINNSLEDSPNPLADKLKKVNERWERIVEALSKRVTDIEKCINKQRQFEEETSGLRSWLGEVEVFLEAEEAAVGDIETLQAQLEQSNALQDDIETLKNNVKSIGVTAQHFQSAGDLELKESVSSQLTSLTDRWENAIAKAAHQNASLKDALNKSRKVWKELEDLNSWLDETESDIPVISAIETTSELNTSLSLMTKIKDDLNGKVGELENLNSLGKEMMSVEKAQQCSELAQMLEDVNDRWKNLTSEINARNGLLSTCKENYENFKKLSSSESKWLDQLAEKLEKSKLKITDAEEISESLYDLDEFLRSHSDALERAQKIGESLTSSGVMTVAVQNTIHNLSSRFDSLSSKAHEEQQRLEGGVEEAQDLERDYVSVLENLSSSLMLLDQVPKEIQLSEIEKQLITHQEVLQKMQQRIEAYRSQGNTQAAQRLQDQLTHLVKQYDEVEERIKLIQQSKDFDQKLETISRQLTDINEQCKEYSVKSIESEHLESQLNRCMDIYRSLSLLKSNVEEVISTGRKIVKEGITSDPESLTLQLDQLKAFYNQLGGSVTEQRGRLESGVKQSRKAEKEVSQLEEWLNITEKELDLREASHPVKNFQQELDFAKHAYDDVMRKKPVLTSIKETVSSLVNLFGGELTAEVQERVQDQTIVWERVQKRLSNRIENLKKDQGSMTSDVQHFVLELGEIQTWLERTENSLSKFDDLSTSEKESVLRNIAADIEQHKTRIEETKESSKGALSDESELNYRIEPEISGIKRRLEHISGLVKMKESKFLSFINKETFQRPLTDLYVRMDSDDGNTDVGNVARSSLNTRHFTKSALEGKDSSLHAKKRFGKVYKSDEMTLLDDPSLNKQESKFVGVGHPQIRSSLDSRWSSSSSSAHFSLSEGSVDFGSESQASWSGDFDDFTYGKIITNQRLSSNSATGSDKLRFSYNSFGSFEANKDDVLFHDSLTEDIDTNVTDDVKESSSSADDDSDTENISKVRISAATMYENEVIMDLEMPTVEGKRRSSGRIRSSDLENEFNFVDSFKYPVRENDVFQENLTKATVNEDNLEAYNLQTESLVSQQSSKVNRLISKLSDDMEEGNSGKKSSKLVSDKNVLSENSEKTERKDANILQISSPTVSAECLDKSVGGLTIRPHLERQLSIDSSVSTLSEAETVIHVDNASKNQCKDSSVKKVFSFNEEKPKVHQKPATAKSLSSEELNFSKVCEHSFSNKDSCGSIPVKKSGDASDVELSGSLKIVKLKHISKLSSQENLDLKKNKNSKDDKLQKQSSKSLSSVSSGSIEEQEISLDISDPSHSDSSSLSKKEIIDKNKQKPSNSKKEGKDSVKERVHSTDYFEFSNRNLIQQLEESSVSVRRKNTVKTDKFAQGGVDVNPRSIKGKRGLEFYSKAESDIRFSTGSFNTDFSEGELIFSETEGEEFPNDDTSDDDLNLEEEALKKLAERKETPKEDILMSKEDNIETFLNRVSHMVDKISVFRDKGDNLPKYTEVQLFAEEFEQGVCQLEPDVATLISKGDTLTLKTHMSDVPKANAIRLAVNNLRKSWTDLKERGEVLKKEAEQVKSEVRAAPMKAKALIHWLEDVSKKLDMANNVEKHIKILENEIAEKRDEIEKLNTVGEFLKRYKYEELQPMLTLINIRWSDINIHLSQFQKVGISKKSFGEGEQSKEEVPISVIPDFLASVNRVRESISSISRQMNSEILIGSKYEKLSAKEEELKSIKKELERLKPKVDNIETERLNTLKKANQSQMDQVRRVIDKLREEWAQVNRGYTDRYEQWVHSKETLGNLHKNIEDFSQWMNTVEEKIRSTSNQSKQEAKNTQKELEKQVTLKHRLSQSLQILVREVVVELPPDESKKVHEKVENLLKRWKALLLDLSSRRERIASEDVPVEGKGDTLNSIVAWIDQGFALMDTAVNVTDETLLSAHTTAVNNHLTHLDSKLKQFNHIKNSSSSPASQELRNVESDLMKIATGLPEYRDKLETKLKVLHLLFVDADKLYKWIEDTRIKIALRDLTLDELKQHRDVLRQKSAIFETLDNTSYALSNDAESKGLQVSEKLKSRMNSIEARLKSLETQFSTTELLTTLNQQRTEETFVTSSVTSSMTPSTVSMVTSTPSSSVNNVVTTLVTTSVQNAVKKEEIALKRDSTELPPAPFPKTPDTSSPTVILAALDKSILQIRDWLTLMQQMSAQQKAAVGESDNIRKLIEKQKSVLRELESKKPQLDELVASANTLKEDEDRSQLHQQVSKLREHWDETNSAVLARKTQLDAMLNDTHKFDSKRLELETWLSRMESRFERMHPIARAPDLIDQQMREQKAFHAEVNQYKHHIDLFTQMIGRLSTIYQNDDTRKLKKASEALNQRFNNLNTNIISRGKTLYSAINSTHNLSKALEKFISWLSEAESTVSSIEMEVDKMPPSGTGRRDSSIMRMPFVRLKDLQSEIESHKDVFASLNATGQKLLGTLENQDEALLLHRRLGEMNHRWNTLKYKSIAIRNRLEGTAENWSSLLLSLRELIEWVIRKDTELSALGPLVGDVKLLGKYENDLTIFRRGLDEKQPVIESNLKSGRQLIASEPPLSDTSDSEAGRDVDGDARYRGEENTRDLTRSVRREVTKLSEKWAALWERAANLASQVSLAYKKLGVLLKTAEEVGSRLEESEKVVSTWGPLPQDQNLADQYVHNIRKFRETLPDLQRGVDDVNDQAARFSSHNVPLTPANSAALHDINSRWKNLETTVNDRWRQVAGRSREVTPLTPAQLASSVSPPWERATATNKVPYYINHAQETTHWDHPQMMDLLDSLSEFNHIKFSAYRTATKLRSLQKKLSLDRAKLQMVTDVFDEHGLRGQNDRLIDVNDMIVVLSTLYGRISSDYNDVNTTLATDLCLNWLLNVYDSQRTGQMRVLSFRVGLICLCRGHLEEKYRYMFRLIADPNRLVDQRKLGLLLHDCVQVPRQLGEVAAFGGSNIEPSVRSCFTKAGKDRETIEAVHFLTWVQQEPQSLVWLAVLHRVAASESVQHQVKCNICKTYPIVGLRYRCLKCLSFDMCQRCFFEGRSSKSHKITHPMHEYCTATTAGDEMKDFTKALKNKFKSKRSLQKHTKKGYLPVQTVLEGDPLESPSPSPSHNVSSQDMHSRLELYASRLAEVELRTNSNSTPDSEDEHGLIAQYCQSLSSTDAPFPVPKSPLQIMASVDADQKDELEQMIKDLEEENRALQAEYERLKSEQPMGSVSEDGMGQRSEAEMLAEAKLLREHKERLEARMSILEDHNRQLEAQLQRLRQLLVEQQTGMGSPNKSSTLQTKSVTASQLAMDSPGKINGHATQGGSGSAYEGLDQMSEYVRPPPPPVGSIAHMGNLYARAGDPEKPVGSPVASMSRETENGSHSDDVEDQSDENDYDNTVSPIPSKSE